MEERGVCVPGPLPSWPPRSLPSWCFCLHAPPPLSIATAEPLLRHPFPTPKWPFCAERAWRERGTGAAACARLGAALGSTRLCVSTTHCTCTRTSITCTLRSIIMRALGITAGMQPPASPRCDGTGEPSLEWLCR
eukprot:1073896-Rhodomonas_salina.2